LWFEFEFTDVLVELFWLIFVIVPELIFWFTLVLDVVF
jgi:hypothetical protein